MADFPNCSLTGRDSDIVLPYGYIEGSDKFRSFVRITGTVAYTPICGVVIAVETDDVDPNCYMVTIQYSANISIRIGHLATTGVAGGEALVEGMFVGSPYNGEVDFYYLTVEETPLTRPIYVAGFKTFPHEPTLVLNNILLFQRASVYE